MLVSVALSNCPFEYLKTFFLSFLSVGATSLMLERHFGMKDWEIWLYASFLDIEFRIIFQNKLQDFFILRCLTIDETIDKGNSV